MTTARADTRFLLNRLLVVLLSGLLSCLQAGTAAAAIDPTLDWFSIENEYLIVHYADGDKALAERALSIADQAHARFTAELDWRPREKTHIVLSDETDQPNGYATPFYFNRTVLFLAPPTTINTLEDFDDWYSTLITHEYLHIVHLDKAAGLPDALRGGLGRFQLLFPNVYQPAWVLEGLATHKETDHERGVGRGQSTTYQAMMRAEVLNGIQPLDHVNLPVVSWPAGGTRYLYGTYFIQYLAAQHGEQALHDWVQGYSDNLLPFFINTNARQRLDASLSELWIGYSDWLRLHFQLQAEKIKRRGLKQGERITPHAYYTRSVQALDDRVYFVRDNGYQEKALVRVGPEGEQEVLVELYSRANLDLHPSRGILITRDEYCNRYHVYRDIYSYDEERDELTRLTKCGRYLYAVWHPVQEYIFAVRHDGGKTSLHRLDLQGQALERLWAGEDGEVLGQIDIAADGKTLVAALWRREQGWNIELFDIATGSWQAITRGVEIEMAPQFTPEGDILFTREDGIAYNIYRYRRDDGGFERVSNVMGSAFLASQGEPGGAIYYEGYTAHGFSIFRLDDPSAIETVNPNSDSRLLPHDYRIGDHVQTEYSPWSSLRPRWWFPVLGYSEQRAPLGVTTAGSDALAIHNYQLSAAWDFKLEAPQATINYNYVDRLYFTLQRQNQVTLDADGELAYSTARDIAGLSIAFPFRRLASQHNMLAGVFHDREFLDQKGTADIDRLDIEDNLLGAAWLYNSSKIHPLSISRNDGMSLRVVAEDSDALDSDYSGQVYTLDWRQFLRTGSESVLALRFIQGWGTGMPRLFKLGGEDIGFDSLDLLFGESPSGVFNQRSYTLRGYKEGQSQLQGRRMQKLTAEWRFPIQRNERGIMAPPIGLMQWSGSLFAETGAAYQYSPETYYSSAGVELNIDSNLFYLVPIRLRAGYAHGFDDDLGEDSIYLSLGGIY